MIHNRFIRLVDNQIEVAVKIYEENGVLVKFVADIHDGPKDYWDSILKSLEECEYVLYEHLGKDPEELSDSLRPYRALFDIWNILLFRPLPRENFVWKRQAIGFQFNKKEWIQCDISFAELYEQFRKVLPNEQDIEQYIIKIFHRYLDEHFDTPANNKKFYELMDTLVYEDVIWKVLIHYRNIIVIEFIKQYLDKGIKNLGVFYGALHGNDIEDFLLNEGFMMVDEIWIVNRD